MFSIPYFNAAFGEQKIWYRQIPGVEEALARLQIPDDERLWGWGYVRKTTAVYSSLLERVVADLEAHVHSNGDRVDYVISCLPGDLDLTAYANAISSVAERLDVPPGQTLFVTTRGCSNTFEAFATARELLSGSVKCALIILLEATQLPDVRRVTKYALFSDVCVAMVVRPSLDSDPVKVLAISVKNGVHASVDEVLFRDLERACIDELLESGRVSITDVHGFFYLNLFQPLRRLKSHSIGFTTEQIPTVQIEQVGHCFGADPVISFCRHILLDTPSARRAKYVICGSGPTSAGAALLEYTPSHTSKLIGIANDERVGCRFR